MFTRNHKGQYSEKDQSVKVGSAFFLSIIMVLSVVINSCIGTDVLEEEQFDPILRITSQVVSIKEGEQFQFEYVYFNEVGDREMVDVIWTTTNPSILDINMQGLASAISQGNVSVILSYLELKDTLDVEVTTETMMDSTSTRTGSFSSMGSYDVSGTVTLRYLDMDNLELVFQSDFSSSSGPGLYVYLSNSNNSTAGGVELGELQSNSGEQTYSVPNNVEISTYDFVLVHCKPYNVTFGWAELN